VADRSSRVSHSRRDEVLSDAAASSLTMNKVTRRSAVAGLISTISFSAVAASRSEPDFDVLIVGAGAAGIAAGRRLAASKRTFAIIEATDRRGGRCFTDTNSFSVPYDKGACLMHLPAASSLAKLANASGAELYPDPVNEEVRIPGRKAFDRGLEEIHSKDQLEEFYTSRVRCYRAISIAAAGKDDISCEDALPADLDDWRQTMEFALGPYRFGTELKDLAVKEYAVSIDRSPAVLCRQGAGVLLNKLALGLPTRFFSPVTLVDWGDRSVRLETGGGILTARAAIITASTAVLASGKIKFRPNLPVPHSKAFDTLKLGTYDNVAIEFDGNALRLGANEVVFERAVDGKAAALFANVHGTRLSTLILAGKIGAELADKGASAMTDFALDWVSHMFGSSAKKSIVRTQAFSWNKQPWTLGALSSCDPGALEARKALAEPVNGVLWFAGEAVNQTFWATVGGAWQDGERAADAVIARLK
jgi:monoamine oxidase